MTSQFRFWRVEKLLLDFGWWDLNEAINKDIHLKDC